MRKKARRGQVFPIKADMTVYDASYAHRLKNVTKKLFVGDMGICQIFADRIDILYVIVAACLETRFFSLPPSLPPRNPT